MLTICPTYCNCMSVEQLLSITPTHNNSSHQIELFSQNLLWFLTWKCDADIFSPLERCTKFQKMTFQTNVLDIASHEFIGKSTQILNKMVRILTTNLFWRQKIGLFFQINYIGSGNMYFILLKSITLLQLEHT